MSIRKIDGVLIDAGTLVGELPAAFEDAGVAAGLIAAAIPKVKLETRDMAAESGDVSYTGYGFQPSGLVILASLGITGSIGSSEPALAEHCIYNYNVTPPLKYGANVVNVSAGNSDRQAAVVKTYDVDGFTLTWTKTATPTGTATLHVFAFR